MWGARSEGGLLHRTRTRRGVKAALPAVPGARGVRGSWGRGSLRVGARVPVLVFRRGVPRLLPSSLPRAFPPLRSLWQEAVLSADGHGEGISEAEGSLLALLQEKSAPSPRPLLLPATPGTAWGSHRA